jgi:hypothetical protein
MSKLNKLLQKEDYRNFEDIENVWRFNRRSIELLGRLFYMNGRTKHSDIYEKELMNLHGARSNKQTLSLFSCQLMQDFFESEDRKLFQSTKISEYKTFNSDEKSYYNVGDVKKIIIFEEYLPAHHRQKLYSEKFIIKDLQYIFGSIDNALYKFTQRCIYQICVMYAWSCLINHAKKEKIIIENDISIMQLENLFDWIDANIEYSKGDEEFEQSGDLEVLLYILKKIFQNTLKNMENILTKKDFETLISNNWYFSLNEGKKKPLSLDVGEKAKKNQEKYESSNTISIRLDKGDKLERVEGKYDFKNLF